MISINLPTASRQLPLAAKLTLGYEVLLENKNPTPASKHSRFADKKNIVALHTI